MPKKGYKQTKEHREKCVKLRIGIKRSEETKRKMSESAKGNKNNIGKKFTEEHKQKLSESNSGERGSNWQGEKSYLPYCPKFNKQKKEEIREQYNRKCYICGKDKKNNISDAGRHERLCVHHIDEDKEQGCNGKEWKLVPICRKCHNKVHKHKIKV